MLILWVKKGLVGLCVEFHALRVVPRVASEVCLDGVQMQSASGL